MSKEKRAAPCGSQKYYKYILDQCVCPEEGESFPIWRTRKNCPVIRDGKLMIYNGHMGTFVDSDG